MRQGRRALGAVEPHILFGCVLALALTTASCAPSQPNATRTPTSSATPSRSDSDLAEHELWYTISAQGKRLGFEHVRRRRDPERAGSWLFESRQQITLSREGDLARQAVELSSWEAEQGELQRFEVAYDSGGERTVTTGRVVEQTLRLQTTMGARTDEAELAWPKDALGLSAPLSLFLGQPPQPGLGGQYQTLAPVINQIVTAEWKAGPWEEVELDGGNRNLLRVDLTLTLPQAGGMQLRQSLWLDSAGRPLRLVDHQTGLTWLQASRSAALAAPVRGARLEPVGVGSPERRHAAQPSCLPEDSLSRDASSRRSEGLLSLHRQPSPGVDRRTHRGIERPRSPTPAGERGGGAERDRSAERKRCRLPSNLSGSRGQRLDPIHRYTDPADGGHGRGRVVGRVGGRRGAGAICARSHPE